MPTVRQTDDAGKRLPFDTKFPDRWSNNNDGTTYEPCTAVTDKVLRQFKLDPASVEDAAAANHQTARGCNWRFKNDSDNSLTQIVGNAPPPAEYRSKNIHIFNFLPDITINQRQVLRFTFRSNTCATALQSGTGMVSTRISIFRNTPPMEDICEMAVNVTRATIDEIPR